LTVKQKAMYGRWCGLFEKYFLVIRLVLKKITSPARIDKRSFLLFVSPIYLAPNRYKKAGCLLQIISLYIRNA